MIERGIDLLGRVSLGITLKRGDLRSYLQSFSVTCRGVTTLLLVRYSSALSRTIDNIRSRIKEV